MKKCKFCDNHAVRNTDMCSKCYSRYPKVHELFMLCQEIKEGVRPISNYERIKRMGVKEMAKFINRYSHKYPPYCSRDKSLSCDQACLMCAVEWLESGVNTDDR